LIKIVGSWYGRWWRRSHLETKRGRKERGEGSEGGRVEGKGERGGKEGTVTVERNGGSSASAEG